MQEEAADESLIHVWGAELWTKAWWDLVGLFLKAVQGWGRGIVLLTDEDTEGPKGFMDMVQLSSMEGP